MAVYGYARVSTALQDLKAQEETLLKYGCDKIFFEKASAKNLERLQLTELLKKLRENDVLVVVRLDRLARSLRDLMDLILLLESKNVEFVSLNENLDTASSVGKLMFQIVGAFAEFERNLISERTKVGLESARARGKIGGKPKGLSDEAKAKATRVKELYDQKTLSIIEIARVLEIGSKATIYKYLKYENERLAELNK